MPPDETPRKRFKISLRTLLLVIAIICIPLGIRINRVRKQDALTRRIHELGGDVVYDVGVPVPWWLGPLGRPMIIAADLSNTPATGEDISRVAELRALQRLNLEGTQTSDAEIAELASLRDLQHLLLSGTQVSDECCQSLAKLTRLRSLMLRDCAISDRGLAQLSTLSNLESFDLRSTDITPAGMAALKQLTYLQSLAIDANFLTAENIPHLASFPNLMLDVSVAGSSGKQLRDLLQRSKIEGRATLGPDGPELWNVTTVWQQTAAGVAELVSQEAGLKELDAFALLELLADAKSDDSDGWMKSDGGGFTPGIGPVTPPVDDLKSIEDFAEALELGGHPQSALVAFARRLNRDDIPRLIELLGDPDVYRQNQDVCRYYSHLLVRLGHEDATAIEQLRQLLSDEDTTVRAITAYGLDEFWQRRVFVEPDWEMSDGQRQATWEMLKGLVEDPHWEVRMCLAEAIMHSHYDKGDDAVPVLLQLVADSHWAVHAPAQAAIDRVSKDSASAARSAAPALRELMSKHSGRVRGSISAALNTVERNNEQLGTESARTSLRVFSDDPTEASLQQAASSIANAATWPSVVKMVVAPLLKLSRSEKEAVSAAARQALVGVATAVRDRHVADEPADQE